MIGMPAMQSHTNRKDVEKRNPCIGQYAKKHQLHIAYFLCYPYMVKQAGRESSGPWDQRYEYNSEVV